MSGKLAFRKGWSILGSKQAVGGAFSPIWMGSELPEFPEILFGTPQGLNFRLSWYVFSFFVFFREPANYTAKRMGISCMIVLFATENVL